MNFNILLPVVLLALVLTTCHRKGCTDPDAYNYDENAKKDDGSCQYPPESIVTFDFVHSFDSLDVSASSFEELIYTNSAGNIMSITKLDYLISDVRFFKSTSDSIVIDSYHLVQLSDPSSLEFSLPEGIPCEKYTGLAFNIGFIQTCNTSGAYPDLNAQNWGWPDALGGGYHQLQLEGRYIDIISDTGTYNFHSGSTVRKITGADTTFHENYIYVNIPFTETQFNGNATIKLNMNISEWFKNPFVWDLNSWSGNLMGNYDAQVEMRNNGSDVFSLESISQ